MGVRVLVVDDSMAIRYLLRTVFELEERVETVLEAGDVEEALRLLRTPGPDVIVLDQQLPGRTGLEVVAEIRAQLPHVRVVMFTAMHSLRDRALESGADAFVGKDTDLDLLLDAVVPAA